MMLCLVKIHGGLIFMNERLMETIKIAKTLKSLGIVYIQDSFDLNLDISYQIICEDVQKINLFIKEEEYLLLKEHRKKLIEELSVIALTQCGYNVDNPLIGEYMKNVIREFFIFDHPDIMDDICFFDSNFVNFQQLCGKAYTQVHE